MKKLMLILLMVGFLCPASGYSQDDSIKIIQKLNQLEQVTNETKVLLKKADIIEKKKSTLIKQLKDYVDRIKAEMNNKERELKRVQLKENSAIKENNVNGPVEEVKIPDGADTVRGSFLYRLFHQNNYILRPYKIVNDEKVYLD